MSAVVDARGLSRMRVNTLARTMLHVVRPEREGSVLTCPASTRARTSAAVRP